MKPTITISIASMALSMALTAAAGGTTPQAPEAYPQAPSDPTVVDTYFDLRVADPFRPLENDTAEATLRWVDAENALTGEWLAQIPYREAIRKRLLSFNDYRKSGSPWWGRDGRIYFYENDGLRNQSVLMVADTLGAEASVFIDPNTLSNDGTVALTGIYPSEDGKYTAYTISRKGSDWTEIYVMETATGRLLPDHIEWAKFTGASWSGDGFFYSAYPRPEAGKEFSNANEGQNIYYHALGTPQSDDRLEFSDPANPLHFHTASTMAKGKLLFMSIGGQGNGNALRAKRLDRGDTEWTVIEPTQLYSVDPVGVKDDYVYYTSTKDAPNGRVMRAHIDTPDQLEVFIPEDTSVLADFRITKNRFITVYNRDAATHAYLLDGDARLIREIEFPTLGSASFTTSQKHDDMFYTFSSFLYPSSVFRYDEATGVSTPWFVPEIPGFDPSLYVTEQVFYPSADGTLIPMFITRRKDIERNGNNPVYLYGYGGFNISMMPGFSSQRLFWLENGGIYAVANLRGGGEYGEKWHEAGTLQQKLNVFDDFIAAAQYLQSNGWTRPELTVIEGGSNGGLLVGATVNIRPDLFGVAIPRVGVMDMMRYHLFTIGWNWAHDYGTSADSPEMARYLLGYSPVHTISETGGDYPAILVTTADHDDRVVPAHSFKYAATLQQASTGPRPKLIRIDHGAGHGAGKPVSKVIDEWTDIYSFIFGNLGIVPDTVK